MSMRSSSRGARRAAAGRGSFSRPVWFTGRALARAERALVEGLEGRTLFAAAVWVGGVGNWNVAANWTIDGVPGARVPGSGDTVTIDAAGSAVTLTDDRSVATLFADDDVSLNIAAGSLSVFGGGTVEGPLTVTGTLQTTNAPGGVLRLLGATTLNGNLFGTVTNDATITVPGGGLFYNGGVNNGTIEYTGAADHQLPGNTTNNGTIKVTGTGALAGNVFGGTFINAAAGVVDFQTDAGFKNAANGAVVNRGTIRKSGGTGTSTVDVPHGFTNDGGTLAAAGGELRLAGNFGATSATTTLNAAAGARVSLAGASGTRLGGPMTGSGAGRVVFAAGDYVGIQPNGTAGDPRLNFPAGYAQVTNALLRGGIINVGTLDYVDDPANPTAPRQLPGGMINRGTLRLLGNSSIGGNGIGDTFLNDTAGVVELHTDAGFTNTANGAMINRGTIKKVGGTGTSTIRVPNGLFNEGGTFAAATGEIRLAGDFGATNATTTLNAAVGARISLATSSGTRLGGPLTGSGAGNVVFASSDYTGIQPNGNPGDPRINFPAGYAQVTGALLRGGLINVGTLDYVDDPANPTAPRQLPGGMINRGTLRLLGTQPIGGNGIGDTFLNDTAGLIEFHTDAGFANNANGNFFNRGVVRKVGGTGVSLLNPPNTFRNEGGTFESASGELRLGGDFATTAALTALNATTANAVVSIDSDSDVRLGGPVTGSGLGHVLFAGGWLNGRSPTLDPAEPAELRFMTPGYAQVTAGIVGENVINVGTLDYVGAADHPMGGNAVNRGTIRVTGAGNLVTSHGATFTNDVGGLIDFQTDAGIVPPSAGGGAGDVRNRGTIRKSAGTRTLIRPSGTFTNEATGTLDVQAGTVAVNSSVTAAGGWSFNVATGARVELGGSGSYGGTLTSTGGGRVAVVSGGTLSNGSAQPAVLNFPAGAFSLDSATLSGNGWTNTGDVTFLLGSGMSTQVTNRGTWTLSGTGNFVLGGSFTNDTAGTLALAGDVSTGNFLPLTNRGTVVKTAGTGVANFQNATLHNTGTVRVDSGTFRVFGHADQVDPNTRTLKGGTWVIGGGATLDLTNSATYLTNDASVTFAGPGASFPDFNPVTTNNGTLAVSGGATFTTAGSLTNNGTLVAGPGGTLAVSGAFAQSAAATTRVQIGGRPASNLFGRVTSTGPASLDGTLDLQLVDGFGPTGGDGYTVMTFPSHNGDFATVTGEAPFFDAVTDPDSVTLNVTASAGDLAAGPVTAPPTASVGGTATVTWTITNLSGSPVAGAWNDTVYLSLDETLTPDDLPLGTRAHAGGLGAGASYSASLDVAVPPLADGTYKFLVVADSTAGTPDTSRANNAAASAPVALQVPALTLGVATAGTIAAGQDRLFRVDLTPQATARLSAAFDAPSQALFLVRRGAVPTESAYDFAAADLASLQRQLTLTNPSGRYYVLLRGLPAAGTGKAFTLRADALALALDAVGPTSGSNKGKATLTLRGSGFTPDAAVSLAPAAGGSPIGAADVVFKDSTTLFVTFDLTGKAVGSYAVRVSQPAGGAVERPNAFTVNADAAGTIEVGISSPRQITPNRQSYAYVTYRNTGQTDVVAPLMLVRGDPQVKLRAPGTLGGGSSSILLLGINEDGPAGVLPPGASGTIRVPFVSTQPSIHVFTTFEVLALDQMPAAPVNWDAIKGELRSQDLPAAAFEAAYANFRAAVGSTWRDLNANLADNATYLSRLGEYTHDVDELIAFEFMQAGFSELAQRYALGALGRGRTAFWEQTARTAADGDVTVQLGMHRRTFYRQRDGSYVGLELDLAKLTHAPGGAYQLRETDGALTAFRPDGKLDYAEDRNGQRVSYHYDGAGRLDRIDYPNGDALAVGYNAQGRVTSLDDGLGHVTTYTYDVSAEHLLTAASAEGTTTFTYVTGQGAAREHAVSSIRLADGSHQYFEYDAQGRLARRYRDGGAEEVRFAYDSAAGQSVTDASNATSQVLKNQFGRVGAAIDPLGRTIRYTYNDLVQVTGVQTSDGLTSFGYDARGNLASVVDPLGRSNLFTYDPVSGSVTSFTDAAGRQVTYTLDARGNTVAMRNADGKTATATYDAAGAMATYTSFAGRLTTNSFDAAGLLKRRTFDDGSYVDYGYDARRNLRTATRSTGEVTTYGYDAADRVASVSYPNGTSLAYTYDAGGRLASMTTGDGFAVNYGYDAVGRLTRLTDAGGAEIARYAYDAVGRLERVDQGNGTYTTYDYDAMGDQTAVVNHAPGGAVLSRFTYGYDAMGRRTSMTTGAGTTAYAYDPTGQLTRVTLPDGRTITYAYDAAGNRTAVNDDGTVTPYAANALNQYTSVGSTTYTYDDDGNLLTRAAPGGTTTYTYDDQGNLVSVAGPGGDAEGYAYDGAGNRISVTRNGVTTHLLVDPLSGASVVGEYGGSASTAGAALAHYTYGHGLNSRVAGGAGGSAGYYQFDGVGNAAALTGAGGAVLNSYTYLPFGELLSSSTTVANPFTFNAQHGVMQDATGLSWMRARSYDAALGRFTQPDPIQLDGGDANFYRFAHNDPVNAVDPSGLGELLISSRILKGEGPTITEKLITGLPTGDVSFKDFGDLARGNPSDRHPLLVTLGGTVGGGGAFASSFSALPENAAQSYQMWRDSSGRVGTNVKNGTNPWTHKPSLVENAANVNKAAGRLAGGARLVLRHSGWATVALTAGDVVNYFEETGYETPWNEVFPPEAMRRHTREFLIVQLNLKRGRSGSETAFPGDPNEIIGPDGVGPHGHLDPRGRTFGYEIHFQNKPEATAPAQRVVVTQQLDPDLDFATFQLGDFSFGGNVYPVPAGRQNYATRVTLSGTLAVDVTATFDPATGQLRYVFDSVDPRTGEPPEDVADGFLPPDRTAPEGRGYVTYTVNPKSPAPTGTRWDAEARIVFDAEAPLDTPAIRNVSDVGPPSSGVGALPATTTTTSFPVTWAGTDDAGGSGVATYDVYVSDDNGPYSLFRDDTTATSATFAGANGHTYRFYSVATDLVGHAEAAPFAPDATTTVSTGNPSLPRLTVDDVSDTEGHGGTKNFTFTVRLSAAGTQPVRFRFDTADGTARKGSDYTAASGNVTIPAGQRSRTVVVKVRGDRTFEPDETFQLRLSNVTNATLADGTGVAAVRNDDPDPKAGAVSKFYLVNAFTDKRLFEIKPEMTIDLAKLSTRRLSIEAATGPSRVGSVSFTVDRRYVRTENVFPYALAGDDDGDFFAGTLPLGWHTLTATPFSKPHAGGSAGVGKAVRFRLVDSAARPANRPQAALAPWSTVSIADPFSGDPILGRDVDHS